MALISAADIGRRDESYFVDGPIPKELVPGLTRDFTSNEITAIRHRVRLTSAHQDLEHPRCLWVCGPPAVGKSTIIGTKSQELFGSEENAVLIDGAVLRECHEGWKMVVADGFQRHPRPLIHRNAWDMLKKSKVIEVKKKEILEEAVRQRQNICIPEAMANLEKVLQNVKMLHESGYEQHLVCLWAPRKVLRRRGEARQAQEGKTFSMKDYVYSVTSSCELAEYFVKTYSAHHCSIMTTDRFPNLVLSISELREYARLAAETEETAVGSGSCSQKILIQKRFKHAGARVKLGLKFGKNLSAEKYYSEPAVKEGQTEQSEDPSGHSKASEIDDGTMAQNVEESKELETVKLKGRIVELEAQVRSLNIEHLKELESELRRKKELESELRRFKLQALASTACAICAFVALARTHWHRR